MFSLLGSASCVLCIVISCCSYPPVHLLSEIRESWRYVRKNTYWRRVVSSVLGSAVVEQLFPLYWDQLLLSSKCNSRSRQRFIDQLLLSSKCNSRSRQRFIDQLFFLCFSSTPLTHISNLDNNFGGNNSQKMFPHNLQCLSSTHWTLFLYFCSKDVFEDCCKLDG